MLETNTTTKSPEISPQPLDIDTAIDRMLTLRWPQYTDPDHYRDTVAATLMALETDEHLRHETPLVNGFYIDVADVGIWEETSPVEIRKMTAETDAVKARQLARLLADGPFGACNPRVAAAFRDNIADATTALLAALDTQDGGESKYSHETYDYDSGLSLQALTHTLASIAVQLGAIDYHEAHAGFDTQSYTGVMYGSKLLRDGGICNSYGTRSLYEMERAEEHDWSETPTILDIAAEPGKRALFGLRFVSDTLTDRFTTETSTERGKYTMNDFNIRIDFDDKSPSGFSVDVGRDERSLTSLSRNADPAGRSLQSVRPEQGSRFTDHFDGVTKADMDEFISNLADMLRADAEMDRLDRTLYQTRYLR